LNLEEFLLIYIDFFVFILEKLKTMFKNLIRQLFSSESRLTSLRLDIFYVAFFVNLDQCLTTEYNLSSSVTKQYQFSYHTLRCLYIRLKNTIVFEHIIEHVPNLETLYVCFKPSLMIWPRSESDIEALIRTNGNWFNKVR